MFTCDKMTDGAHECYMRKKKPKKKNDRLISFDFESRLDEEYHQVNYAVAKKVCSVCISTPDADDCNSCGSRCLICRKKGDYGVAYEMNACAVTCGKRTFHFSGELALEEFCKWVFCVDHKNYTVIAHNMSGYDGIFVLNFLLKNGYDVDFLMNGTKIMKMKVKNNIAITLLDSCNFLPMRLKDFSKTFNLSVKKGYFPYLFNTLENQNYCGVVPEMKYFDSEGMMPDERPDFLEWYGQRCTDDQQYNLRDEMGSYCEDDVKLLKIGSIAFRHALLSITDGRVDPFNQTTIASSCMCIYKTLFLREYFSDDKGGETTTPGGAFLRIDIAKISREIYAPKDKYSVESIKYIEMLAHFDELSIRHALNGGEYQIPGTNYRVDGYDESTGIVYEYNGCYHHGCPECFNEYDVNKSNGSTHGANYMATLKRSHRLKELGYRVIEFWSHELKGLSSEKKKYIANADIQPRLVLRDAFFGGRTGCSKVYHMCSDDEKIRYVDFTSLYPWVNKYGTYPSGHAKITTGGAATLDGLFGVALIRIRPPHGLYHPVLPYVSNGKLMFPLCRTCVESENSKPCCCSDRERELIGTWCTPEITKAIEKGYEVVNVYETYHFEKKVSGKNSLFAEYVNTFLKIKQESSGYPSNIETESDKRDYITEYRERERV